MAEKVVQRIIVGVDGSAPSLGAVMWAERRAEELGLALELIHVLDDEWGATGAEHTHDLERRAARLLASVADSNPVPAGVSTRLVHGSTITELAREVGIHDLLVIGSHKTGYLRGRALGSLSVRLAPALRGSMLVIPDAPPSPARRGVVLGIGPVTNDSAIDVAVRETRALGSDLTLIAAAPQEHRGAASAMLDRAAARVRSVDADLALVRRVSDRRPSEALLEASRNASLLVLGTTPVPSLSSGSTTHEVLMNPLSAVWIARS